MSYTPFGEMEKPPRKQLNPEELQHLFTKLSSDEMKELQDALKNCTTEVTMTRGVPITAALLGSLYFARTRLPTQYHFGPKGWPFYAILGIGSLTVTNMFFMSTCKERVQPKIDELYAKYQGRDANKMTHDYLRQQHRAGEQVPMPQGQNMGQNYTSYDQLRHQNRGESLRDSASSDSFIYGQPSSSSYQPDQTDAIPARRYPSYSQQYPEESTFMSGTPGGPNRPRDITRSEFS